MCRRALTNTLQYAKMVSKAYANKDQNCDKLNVFIENASNTKSIGRFDGISITMVIRPSALRFVYAKIITCLMSLEHENAAVSTLMPFNRLKLLSRIRVELTSKNEQYHRTFLFIVNHWCINYMMQICWTTVYILHHG